MTPARAASRCHTHHRTGDQPRSCGAAGADGQALALDEPLAREIPQARDLDQPEIVKAVVELASENADPEQAGPRPDSRAENGVGRFGAWAERVASDREADGRDKAQMAELLDQALAMKEALATRMIYL